MGGKPGTEAVLGPGTELLTWLQSRCQALGPFRVFEGGTPSRALNPCEPWMGIWAIWDMALPGQRVPSALMQPA